MGEELNHDKKNAFRTNHQAPLRDEEETSRRLGEVYEDLNDFTETKRKIEELIRFKQSLIDLQSSDLNLNSERFKIYKGQAIDAINHLFDECQPGDKKKE